MNLIGDFGDSENGPTPIAIRVVGPLRGKAPGATRWTRIPPLPKVEVEPLPGGPYIVDAWTLTPAIYRGDANRCTVGRTFVRVMWSNGLAAYPTGAEVGAPVVASYRAVYELPNGKATSVAPLEVADLHDHESSFNADNMHDLCLPRPPRGAKLEGVTIGGELIQDPNGDPNAAQEFRVLQFDGALLQVEDEVEGRALLVAVVQGHRATGTHVGPGPAGDGQLAAALVRERPLNADRAGFEVGGPAAFPQLADHDTNAVPGVPADSPLVRGVVDLVVPGEHVAHFVLVRAVCNRIGGRSLDHVDRGCSRGGAGNGSTRNDRHHGE